VTISPGPAVTLARVGVHPERPLVQLPLVAGGAGESPPSRHETVLPAEPAEAIADLAQARARGGSAALAGCCARHPALLEAWARLGELQLAGGDTVSAYASARVAYHRGLDRLRKHGWGGTGMVRWAEPTNRGFLRGLHLLLVAAARLGETDESERCRSFLLELDPDDGIGVRAYPQTPGSDFNPPPLPPD
jgi:hypothetical protein